MGFTKGTSLHIYMYYGSLKHNTHRNGKKSIQKKKERKENLTFNLLVYNSPQQHSIALSRFNLLAEDCSMALSFKSDIQPLLSPFDIPH